MKRVIELTTEQKRLQLVRANRYQHGSRLYLRSMKIAHWDVAIARQFVHEVHNSFGGFLSLDIVPNYFILFNHGIQNLLSINEMTDYEVEALWKVWILFLTLCRRYNRLWT